MNTVIAFTPQEVMNLILSVCGAIVSVSAALTIIVKMIDRAKQPHEELEKRLTAIDDAIQKIEERLVLGNKRFETDKSHIDAIEEANAVTQRALLALLSHSINGNDIDSLRDAKKELEDHLTKGKNYD